MRVQQSTIGALGRLCWYSRVLQEHTRGSLGTEEYYRSYREVVLVLKEHLRGCAVKTEYHRSTGEAVLVQKSTIGALERLCWVKRVL